MNYSTNTQKLVASAQLSIASIVAIVESILLTVRHGQDRDKVSNAKFELKTIFEIVSLKYSLPAGEWLQLLATLREDDDPYIKERSLFIYKQLGSTVEKVYAFLDEVRWAEKFLKQVIEYELLTFEQEIDFLIKLHEKKVKTTSFVRQMLDRKTKTAEPTFAKITVMVSKLSKLGILAWHDISNEMSYTYFICKYPCWKTVMKGVFINEVSIIQDSVEKKGFVVAALRAFKESGVSHQFTDSEFQMMVDAAYSDNDRFAAFMLAAEHAISFKKLKWVKEHMLYRSTPENMKTLAKVMIDTQTTASERLGILTKLKEYNVLSRDKLTALYLMVEKIGPQESYSIICEYGYCGINSLNDKIYDEHFTAFVAA